MVVFALVLAAGGCSSGDDVAVPSNASAVSEPTGTIDATLGEDEHGPNAGGNGQEDGDGVDPTDTTVLEPATSAPMSDDAPTTTGLAPTTTTEPPPSLEDRIVANMQGAQTEYQDFFGDNEPAIVFFHRGDWAAEAVEWPLGSGEHCERATYRWSVMDAISESEFTLLYDELTEDPDCIALPSTFFEVVVSGSREVEGRLVYDITYTQGLGGPITGTRTVCTEEWDHPEPCGLALPGFEMPTPPQG